MPDRKQMIHFCAKCGREMSYKEKKMLFKNIFDLDPEEVESRRN